MKDSYIIDGIRTPIGKYGGTLAGIRTDDLAAFVIKKIVERNPEIDINQIDDVILGCANQSGEDNRNVARMSLLLADLPYTIPGETINRLCASGMSAVINASRPIRTGDYNLVIAGGVENMTRSPFVFGKSQTPYGRDIQIYDTTLGWRFVNPKMKEKYGVDSMGETAENVAEKYKISREDQDFFAYNSQMKATKALEKGRFDLEIVPVEIPQKKGEPLLFAKDEFIRPETTLEGLSKLKPVFKSNGTVTAGNSSGINDGASTLILASEEAINTFNIKPRARIVSSAVVGVEPRIMGIGPVEASKKALKQAGLKFEDISVIELNEAFASQSLACIREWGLDQSDERINPNGGAIALGHPLGMSGARLIVTAVNELELTKGQYALCTMCIGVGQGYATIIERI
jgi:3-oxo-5,6-didehydrosuberyl-CoA/3-oxoadipyl-CoA thiolase